MHAAGLGHQAAGAQACLVPPPLEGVGRGVALRRPVVVVRQQASVRQGCPLEGRAIQAVRREPGPEVPEGLAGLCQRFQHIIEDVPQARAQVAAGPVHHQWDPLALLDRGWPEGYEPLRVHSVHSVSEGLVEGLQAARKVGRDHHPRLHVKVSRPRLVEELKGHDIGVAAECYGQGLPVLPKVLERATRGVQQCLEGVPHCEAQVVVRPLQVARIHRAALLA
mmetsp:Transcript_14760/g.40764  ORF Transcript_14760/g.40764 Transcript_14760/m.40764 type:complete len:222 (+) Transcript_14760:1036-1701(+)